MMKRKMGGGGYAYGGDAGATKGWITE